MNTLLVILHIAEGVMNSAQGSSLQHMRVFAQGAQKMHLRQWMIMVAEIHAVVDWVMRNRTTCLENLFAHFAKKACSQHRIFQEYRACVTCAEVDIPKLTLSMAILEPEL
jgi:hypothetical protein